MNEKEFLLTAKEFASLMNISTSTLTKKLRSGKIKGEKISGRWMIAKSELTVAAQPAQNVSNEAGVAFSVDDFAEKTYLTAAGVIDFLKKKKLRGCQDTEGQWTVDADSLNLPHIRHLVR